MIRDRGQMASASGLRQAGRRIGSRGAGRLGRLSCDPLEVVRVSGGESRGSIMAVTRNTVPWSAKASLEAAVCPQDLQPVTVYIADFSRSPRVIRISRHLDLKKCLIIRIINNVNISVENRKKLSLRLQ